MRHGFGFLNFLGYFALTKTHGRIAVFCFLVFYKGLLTHTIVYQRYFNLRFNRRYSKGIGPFKSHY